MTVGSQMPELDLGASPPPPPPTHTHTHTLGSKNIPYKLGLIHLYHTNM